MQSKTERVLKGMNVLAWVALILLLVQTGAVVVTFSISLAIPGITPRLYMGPGFYPVLQYGLMYYILMISFMVVILVLEVYIAYLVTKILSKIKMENPFKIEISDLMEKISYYILIIWVTAMISNLYNRWLSEQIPGFKENLISGEFILIAGVVFVFSQIFKKGVELQTENELTV